jgi:hypothetical protein
MAAALAKLPEAVLPIGSDTGMFATYGRLALGGAAPYVLGGTDWVRTIAVAHAMNGALSVGGALFACAIARRLGSSMGVAALAGVLIVSFANLSMLSQEGRNPAKLALLPSTIAGWAYVRAYADSPTARRSAHSSIRH